MRYFYIKITVGNTNSTFKVYYQNNISSNNLASKYNITNNTTSPASGVTFLELSQGDGLLVQTPDDMTRIILEDETSNICSTLDFSVGPYGNVTVTDANCEYGSIFISGITGGTGPYRISIETQSFETTGNSVTFTGVTAGEYILTIIDSNGKTYQRPVEIQDNGLSSEIEIVSYPSTSSSSDGIINLISSGGTFNKTLRILKNTQYPNDRECGNLIVRTITGVTEVTTTVTGLTCGAYCLKVTDANNCVVQSQIVEFCATPIQPPLQVFTVNTRYGSTVNQVCSEAYSRRIFSLTQRTLVNGGVYTDINGNPYDGGSTYFKNIGTDDCSYGQIDSNGVYTIIGNCSPCL